MNERQRFWKQAAQEAARDGNGVAAGLFALIAEPSEREQARERRRFGHLPGCDGSFAAGCPGCGEARRESRR